MFNLIDSIVKLIFVTPIVILIIYAFGALGHSFFGGPIWLWITGLLIFSAFGIANEFSKQKEKSHNETN